MKKIIVILVVMLMIIPAIPISAEQVNLVAGKSCDIYVGQPSEHSYMNYDDGSAYRSSPEKLTDGKKASAAERKDENWFNSFRCQSLIAEFDLGDFYAVSGYSAGFLSAPKSAVSAPRYVRLWLSEDKDGWQCVLTTEPGFDLADQNPAIREYKGELANAYKARYIRLEYCCDIYACCDEIEIYGASVSGGEKTVVPDANEQKGCVKSIAGVSDIIKIYNGYYSPDQDRADNTEEELLPYVAYVDKDGKILDTMFDSCAFVPCHGDYPSGGRLVKTSNKSGAVMSDWVLYADNTFSEGINLDALNNVVGRVYSELEKSGKYKVFLTLPYPTILEGEFGDINGDGKAENCKTLAERTAILKWYTDYIVERFKNAKFENLELAGFYWYREEVSFTEEGNEPSLVKACNEYVKKKGLVTLFDPFYLSVGFDIADDFGFEAAVMQPNFAFRTDRAYFSIEMLEEFAQTVNTYGLGVEIETDEPGNFNDDNYLTAGYNYEAYLWYGMKYGYMDALHTYYQGAGPGTFYMMSYADTITSKGQYLRSLYDKTHQFIKHTYKNDAPTLEVSDLETKAGERRVEVDITLEDADSYIGDVKIVVVKEPAHGSAFAISGGKKLCFSADKDYEGEDSFEVYATDGFSVSETKTVKVTITKAPEESKPEESKAAETSVTEENGGGMQFGTLLLLIIAGVAVLALGAWLIIKKLRG